MSDKPMVDRTPRWRRRLRWMRDDPWGVVQHLVGDRTPGLGGPPLNWYSRKMRQPRHSYTLYVSAGDDGHGMSLTRLYDEDRDRNAPVWELDPREQVFVVRFWLWGRLVDWWGLRRKLYFVALHRHIEATKPRPPVVTEADVRSFLTDSLVHDYDSRVIDMLVSQRDAHRPPWTQPPSTIPTEKKGGF